MRCGGRCCCATDDDRIHSGSQIMVHRRMNKLDHERRRWSPMHSFRYELGMTGWMMKSFEIRRCRIHSCRLR